MNVDNFRPEVYNDVISCTIAEPTGVNVRVKVGDSRSTSSRDIRLPQFTTNDSDDSDNDDAGRRTLCQLRIRRKAFYLKTVNII